MPGPPPLTPAPGDPGERGHVTLAPGFHVPAQALRFTFSRSAGPGGQNVNKLATRAELRVAISDLGLPLDAAERLRRLGGRRVTLAGELVLVDESNRSQRRNREACLERLRSLVAEALVAPVARRASKPTRASKRRRLASKQARSRIKRDRRRPEE